MALRDWLTDPEAAARAARDYAESQMANNHAQPKTVGTSLPPGCPLNGGPVKASCRFEAKLFRRMMAEGVLQPGGPCPVIGVCRLAKCQCE